MTAIKESLPRGSAKPSGPGQQSLRELTEHALLSQVIAAGALVNAHGDILYLHGRTGMFLELAPGDMGINNILKMAREGLRRELTTTLHKAAGTKDTVVCLGLRVKTNGHFTTVNLTIRPVTTGPGAKPEEPLYLVILEEATKAGPRPDTVEMLETASRDDVPGATPPEVEARITALMAELHAKEEYLQRTIEELENSTEELKSSSEEMQSVNEEMQSTNEELETSKEELQSVNEELATVNAELQTNVAHLTHANNDMNNLLAGSGIGTLFVDNQLRILRFTPAASTVINLIPTDVGRPVGHIVSNLVGYSSLVADVHAVLATLASKEMELQTLDAMSYTMRIMPYRTQDNVIKGAVITFVDITEMVKTRDALKKANELLRLAVVVRDAHDAITVKDLEGRILAWNPAAVRMYGWSEAEALKMSVHDRIPPLHREQEIEKLQQLSRAEILEPYRTQRLTKSGKIVEIMIIATALLNEAGQMYAIATTERAVEGGTP